MFKYIDENTVEYYNGHDTFLLTKDEAIQLGYFNFTYQGKPISINAFAIIANKSNTTIKRLIDENGFRTGEEILKYYELMDADKILYAGKKYTMRALANVIDVPYDTIRKIVKKKGKLTGEEIKQIYLESKNSFTYQGKPITTADFAKIIGKSVDAIRTTKMRKGFKTGEEIIKYYNNRPKFFYQDKEISILQFAKVINKSAEAVDAVVTRKKFTTGEEVIAYYKKMDAKYVDTERHVGVHTVYITYNGIQVELTDFCKQFSYKRRYVVTLMQKKGFKTGEEIIAHFKKQEKRIPFTYQSKQVLVKDFAELLGMNTNTVRGIMFSKGFHTGEEIITYYKGTGKL